jgi:hypothetical protein
LVNSNSNLPINYFIGGHGIILYKEKLMNKKALKALESLIDYFFLDEE